MSEMGNEHIKTYSTGELAEVCGVSVRTVQYYDERGLLPPAELTDGGRRIYTEADAAKLRRILLLKSLGLKLATIKDFLESPVSTQVLHDILVEQDARLVSEVDERTQARERIAAMLDSLERTGELPAETTADTNDIMGKKLSWRESELFPVYRNMLVYAIPTTVLWWVAIIYWIMAGNWIPFAVITPIHFAICAALCHYYRKRTAYICGHCHELFVPPLRNWFFAFHTSTTRKVTCTHCGIKDYCAEVSSKRLHA